MRVYIERREWSSEIDSKENPAPYLNLTEELINTIYFNNVWYMDTDNLEEDVIQKIRSHGEDYTWENMSGESVVRVTIG